MLSRSVNPLISCLSFVVVFLADNFESLASPAVSHSKAVNFNELKECRKGYFTRHFVYRT